MNDSINKYFSLLGLLLLSLVGLAAVMAGIFYLLKLFSVAMNTIPGADKLFHLFIVTAPYLILLAAYYLVHTRIRSANRHPATIAARIILGTGSLLCIAGLVIGVLEFLTLNTILIKWYQPLSKYDFAGHLLIMLLSSGVLASGAPKEKSWLDRKEE